MNKQRTLNEINEQDYPQLDSEWIKHYLDSMDIHHLTKILEKLDTETFLRLEKALEEAVKQDAEARRQAILSEIEAIDDKLEKL